MLIPTAGWNVNQFSHCRKQFGDFSKNLKQNSITGYMPKVYKWFYQNDKYTHMLITVLFIIAKAWNQPKCPSMIDWTKNMWYMYTMEYYTAIKKGRVCVLCRDLGECGNHHSHQTDPRTESQTPYVLTHRWVLNNENMWTQREEHHILGAVGGEGERQLEVRREEGWEGITWGEMPDIVST